jgi:hypothetical protein
MNSPFKQKDDLPTKHFGVVCLVLLILLATIERIYGIDRQSLWSDELYAVMASYKHHFSKVWLLMLNDSHPPGYVTLMYYTLPWTGYTDVGIRLQSLIYGIVWIPLVYWLGRRWFSASTGLIAAALVTSSHSAIYFSQEARAYSMLVAFNLANIICLLEILYAHKLHRNYVTGFVISSTIMLYLHYTCFVFFCTELLLCIMLWIFQRKGNLRQMAICFGIPLLLYAPWLDVMLHHLADTSHDWGVSAKPTLDEVCNVFQRLWGPDHTLMVLYSFALAGTLTLTIYRQIRHSLTRSVAIAYTLVFLLVFPVLAFYIESQIWTPIFEKRYFLITLPIMAILAATVISSLLDRLVARPWRILSLVLLLVASSIFLIISNINKGLYSELNKDPVREAVNVIKNDLGNKAASNEYTVLMAFDWFEHYLKQAHVLYDNGWEYRKFYVAQQINHVREYLKARPSIHYFYYLSLRQSNSEGAIYALKQEYKILSKAEITVPTGTIDVFKFSTTELPDEKQMTESGTNGTNEAAKLIAHEVSEKNPETYTTLMTHDWMEAYLVRNHVQVDISWPGRMYYLDTHIANLMDYLHAHPAIDTFYYMALRDTKIESALAVLQLQYQLVSRQSADSSIGTIDIYKFNALASPTNLHALAGQVKNNPLNQAALLVSQGVADTKPRYYLALMSNESFVPFLHLNSVHIDESPSEHRYYSDLQAEHIYATISARHDVQRLYYLAFHDTNTSEAAAILQARYQLVSQNSFDSSTGKIDVYTFDVRNPPSSLEPVRTRLANNPLDHLAKWVLGDTQKFPADGYAILLTHDWFQPYLELQGVQVNRSWDGRFVSQTNQAELIAPYLKAHTEIHSIYYLALMTPDTQASIDVLKKYFRFSCQTLLEAPVGKLTVIKFDALQPANPSQTSVSACPE